MAASDVFIILDTVQYQRRGWIHRNKFTKKNGQEDWLTLPILKSSRDESKIKDVKFRKTTDMKNLISLFTVSSGLKDIEHRWPNFFDLGDNLLNYLEPTIIATNKCLGFNVQVIRASSINSDPDLKGENLIINLCKLLGATTYINSPGGKDLYTEKNFTKAGIKLNFLPEYKGSYLNAMERILKEKVTSLRSEIYSNI